MEAAEVEKIQKTQFAKMLLKRPNDALLIAAEIVGRDVTEKQPLLPVKMANAWPVDPFVLAELERLKNTPISKNEQLIELQNAAVQMLRNGEYEAYHKTQRLISEISGFIGKKEDDSARGQGKLHEFVEAILGPTPDAASAVQP